MKAVDGVVCCVQGASQRQGHEAVQAVHAQLSSGSLQKLVAAPLGNIPDTVSAAGCACQ